MRRIRVVLVALGLVVAMFAAFSGPAMADDLNCRDARGKLIRCHGDLYKPVHNNFNNHHCGYYCGSNRFHYGDFSPYVYSPYVYSPYVYSPYVFGCWEWDGDELEWDDDCD
jgi:hypothetical protein